MRIYVESNFVLECVLEQGQSEACVELLSRAVRGETQLCVPAFCLLEPFTTLQRRGVERNRLREDLERHLREVRRTKSLSDDARRSDVSSLLLRAANEAEKRFREVRQDLLQFATVLPLDVTALLRAEEFERQYGLALPDAVVLATVVVDLERDPMPGCFVNRNTKDFDDPDIRELLADGGCRFAGSFPEGLAIARGQK